MPDNTPWAIVSNHRTKKRRDSETAETVTPSPSNSLARPTYNLDLTSTSILNFLTDDEPSIPPTIDDDEPSIPPTNQPSPDPDPDSDSDCDFDMTNTERFPPGRFTALMRDQLNGPPPSYPNPTKDIYDDIRYKTGTALSTITLSLKDASNASFITDSPADWNLRHGTTNNPKTVPSLPDKPEEPSENDSKYKWRIYTNDLRNYETCQQICTQVLSWLDKVYPGLLDDKKIRDAFPLDLTPQQAFKHIEDNSHFKMTALNRSIALETKLETPYDPITGPQTYFKQLKDTQDALAALGKVYAVTDMRLVVKATAAFTAYFGESSSAFSMSTKVWNAMEEKLQGNTDYATTVFPEFKKYWIPELTRLQTCNPV